MFGIASETASRLNLEEALQNSSSKRVDSMPILLSDYLKWTKELGADDSFDSLVILDLFFLKLILENRRASPNELASIQNQN